MTDFEPTRAAALARLDDFLPHAGFAYATKRNYDAPDTVSRLSPYLRHRLITEEEVLRAVLNHHTPKQAEKFIAEVCWRTYWKGVLEIRPALWTMYQADLNVAWNQVQTNGGLRADWEAACKGETCIDCFDHWARELVATGYLHNHARMWFASIWIFTLRLPWVLGADFFMRHLLDGDAASNTLSWRWVGGLQTKGKTYLARPDNIEKYTNGRFRPTGLATHAIPLYGPDLPERGPIRTSDTRPTHGRIGGLITDDDLCPNWGINTAEELAMLTPQTEFGPLQTAPKVVAFKKACAADVVSRFSVETQSVDNVEMIVDWAQSKALEHVILGAVPTGPTADQLKNLSDILSSNKINLSVQVRPYDAHAWPRATHGFFKFKDVIPSLLERVQ